MTCFAYKKISIKQLDTLYEYLKPLKLERRLTFLKYSKHLIKEGLISESNVDKYSTIDYIRDFEEFERKHDISKLREQIKNEIYNRDSYERQATEKLKFDEKIKLISNFLSNIVIVYAAYKFIKS